MKLTGAENIINEWNMTSGYYDILYRMFLHYYEARLTPGLGDDVETLQLLFDHVLPKFEEEEREMKRRFEIKNGITLAKWFDDRFNEINSISTAVYRNRKKGSAYADSELKQLSRAKEILRDIHRDIHRGCQHLGMFDLRRKMNTKKDFTRDLGADNESMEY